MTEAIERANSTEIETPDYGQRYCVIGAGSSGITVAKNFKQAGIAFDVFEGLPEGVIRLRGEVAAATLGAQLESVIVAGEG